MLEKNLAAVRERLQKAAAKRGASLGDITLVAATKTVPVTTIRRAYALGMAHFGENRLQEAEEKIGALPPAIHWHFIGHLQTNKVKKVLPAFELIHSLDRMRLARRIQREGEKIDRKIDVLLQVNIGLEKSKQGFHPGEVEDALTELATFSHLRILGLMAIAPFFDDPEETRPYFRHLSDLSKQIQIPGVAMKYLSMGMSNDFEVAVEEGANMVRLGSILFGERH
ncbi:MAG: YggS family pyridoxal phosphate-dependent enzyme [Firmicutes bacterium]|nr:YggS family pyridoxal phosphate-dependent enzyme [Bacillota bacterium]